MERETRSLAACVASAKPSNATIANGVYIDQFVRLGSSARHIMKAMAVEGQGNKRERGLSTDLCFQADHEFFRLQEESTYSIRVRDPSEIDFAQFRKRIDFRFAERFVLVHEADEVFHLADLLTESTERNGIHESLRC
jgi:hypothetical protein